MSDVQWWLMWALLVVHVAWSVLNWFAYFEARRIRREAEDRFQQSHQIRADARALLGKVRLHQDNVAALIQEAKR